MNEPQVKGNITLYPIPTMTHMSIVNTALNRHINSRENLSGVAKQLESLLNSLKNEKNLIGNEIWQEIERRINIYLGYKSNNLFGRSGQYGWQTGKLFEHEFAGLFQALSDLYLNKETQKASYTWTKDKDNKRKHRTISNVAYTGNIKGTVQLNSDFNVESFFDNMGQLSKGEIESVVNSNITKNMAAGWVKNPVIREIKTDVYGGGKIDNKMILDWNADTRLVNLLYILNNYKISLKNYSDLSQVKLGSSDPFKAYAGALQTLGFSDNAIRESYIRLKCCYINSVSITSNSSNHARHQKYASIVMSRIKSVFELIGMGIITNSDFTDNVQLFVVNQHNGKTIKVYDTTSLAKQFLSNTSSFSIAGNNPFAAQKITINVK